MNLSNGIFTHPHLALRWRLIVWWLDCQWSLRKCNLQCHPAEYWSPRVNRLCEVFCSGWCIVDVGYRQLIYCLDSATEWSCGVLQGEVNSSFTELKSVTTLTSTSSRGKRFRPNILRTNIETFSSSGRICFWWEFSEHKQRSFIHLKCCKNIWKKLC